MSIYELRHVIPGPRYTSIAKIILPFHPPPPDPPPIDLSFMLNDHEIQTLRNCDFKFLGSLVTFKNSTSDILKYVEDIITSGIEKIDKSLVRNEFKLKIYSDYFLPSIRYHLTVNDLCESHLKSLDALTNRYLKKWSGLARPATLAFLNMPEFLSIPTKSGLYLQCHTLTYVKIRSHSDPVVNVCLDSALAREQEWSRKKSTIVIGEASTSIYADWVNGKWV